MQLSFDVNFLTDAQREHIAGFLMTYPKADGSYNVEKAARVAETGKQMAAEFPSPTGALEAQRLGEEQAAALMPAPSVPAAIDMATAVDTDSTGLPWDGRIHASTKTKKADGTWTARRGAAPEVVAQVTAELKALMAIPVLNAAPEVAFAAAPFIPAPVAVPFTPAVAQPQPFVTIPQAAPNAFVSSPMPAGGGASEQAILGAAEPVDSAQAAFTSLIALTAAAIGNGTLSKAEDLDPICAHFGIPSLPLLGARPDLLPHVRAAVDAAIARRAGRPQ